MSVAVIRGIARHAGLVAQFDHGYAHQLPYPDASFDRVPSSLLLHHLEPAPVETTVK
jgi:ubiquinone/menaquinone biosynthesis C-methylase UbiE